MVTITKSSGHQETFDENKFKKSLILAGASTEIAEKALEHLKRAGPFSSTHDIHTCTYDFLCEESRPLAARYNIKRAIFALGPSGFPFELFVATIFEAQGYKVYPNQQLEGYCVKHEIDIIAQKENQRLMIECKFHNKLGPKTDVTVTLYIKARYDDLHTMWQKAPETTIHQAWVVTNTRFTSDAIQYAQCANIQLLAWNYPRNDSLPGIIDRYDLHPITALTTLTHKQKRELIKEGVILCQHLVHQKSILNKLRIRPHDQHEVIEEARTICELGHQ